MRSVVLLACAIVFGGMPAAASPPSRFAVIDIAAPGLEPDEVEARITTPLERALNEVKSIHQLRSVSRQGSAQIAARLDGPDAGRDLVRIRLLVLEASVLMGPDVRATVQEQTWPRSFPPDEFRRSP